MCQTISTLSPSRNNDSPEDDVVLLYSRRGSPEFPISSVPQSERIDTDVYLINAWIKRTLGWRSELKKNGFYTLVIYDFLLHVSNRYYRCVEGKSSFFLQPVLGGPQDRELVSGAASSEIVISQLEDRDST